MFLRINLIHKERRVLSLWFLLSFIVIGLTFLFSIYSFNNQISAYPVCGGSAGVCTSNRDCWLPGETCVSGVQGCPAGQNCCCNVYEVCECDLGDTQACGMGGYNTCSNDCDWDAACIHQSECTLGEWRECGAGPVSCGGTTCPGYQTCIDPPGLEWDAVWGSCVKYNDSCPCGNNDSTTSVANPYGVFSPYSELCDIGPTSCVDYDEDGCSVACGYSQVPSCGYYNINTPYWRTDLGTPVYNSGELVVADLDNPNPDIMLYIAGPGNGGPLPPIISGTVTSSYNNHTDAGPDIHVESPSHDRVCQTGNVLVDHFPTVEDIKVLDYSDSQNRNNINQIGRVFSPNGWSGKDNSDKDTSNPAGGSNLPNELAIPEDGSDANTTADRTNMYECDDKNPVIFEVSVRDDDDAREVDQINVAIGSYPGDRLGGCGAFETNMADDYVGLTFAKTGPGNQWSVSDLCGRHNDNFEVVPLGGGGNQPVLYSNGSGNVMTIRFAIKFGNVGPGSIYQDFINGQHVIWVKGRDAFSVGGQTHHMYSGWTHPLSPPTGNRYANQNKSWGVDTVAPQGNVGGSMSYNKVTAEIIDVNWRASDKTPLGDDRSGLRSMMFGCYLTPQSNNLAFGDDSVVGYPFDDTYRNSAGSDVASLDPAYKDGYKNAELADLARVLGACQISRRKPTDTNQGGLTNTQTDFTEVIGKFHPFIELPTDDQNDRTFYDGPETSDGYENRNPFPYVVNNPFNNTYWNSNGAYAQRYRKTTWQNFHPVFGWFVANPSQEYTRTTRIGGLEEDTSYNFREIVTDEACNVGVSDLRVDVLGKWAQTIGGEVYTKLGFNGFKVNGDLTNFYKTSPFNPIQNGNNTDVAFSTFGITTGPGVTIDHNDAFGSKWYTDPNYANENVGDYNMLDPDDDTDSLLTEEIFGENKLFDRLYDSVPPERVFIADQSPPPPLSDGSRPCNSTTLGNSCNVNEWEKDLSTFIDDNGDGVYRVAVYGSNSIYFQGNITNYDKNAVLLFYHTNDAIGGSIDSTNPNVQLNFWAHHIVSGSGIYITKGDIYFRSTGQDWVRETDLNTELQSTGELGTKWPCAVVPGLTPAAGCLVKGGGANEVNRDDHIYYDTSPALDDLLDPGVDLYNIFALASNSVRFEKELVVGGDPNSINNDLNIYDVSDRNFERAELFGSAIAKNIVLNRNLIALDNQYIPAEKIVYNPQFIETYVQATTGVFGVTDAQQWNENGLY